MPLPDYENSRTKNAHSTELIEAIARSIERGVAELDSELHGLLGNLALQGKTAVHVGMAAVDLTRSNFTLTA